MATRQYIGARYVPKFFENPNNTAEWMANTMYEPLTVVTYGSNSYTSKKAVPASVGDPSNNPDYWVATGNYNSFINEVNNKIGDINTDISGINTKITDVNTKIVDVNTKIADVNTDISGINERIDKLSDRKFLFIGDSYGEYNDPDYIDLITSYLSLTPGTNVFQSVASGYGFSNTNGKFITLLNNAVITAPNEITDVIVLGGINDAFVISSIESDISAFITASKTKFPNAKIHIGMIGGNRNIAIKNALPMVVNEYQKCAKYGACYISNSEFIMCNHLLIGSDGTHPTADGTKFIARHIVNYILNNSIDVIIPETEISISQNPLTASIRYTIHNELETLQLSDLEKLPYNAIYTNEWETICSADLLPCNGYGNTFSRSVCSFKSGETFMVLPIEYRLTDNVLQYRVLDASNQTLQNVTLLNCSTIFALNSMMF